MLTYEMLTGYPPWYTRDRKKVDRLTLTVLYMRFAEEIGGRVPNKV